MIPFKFCNAQSIYETDFGSSQTMVHRDEEFYEPKCVVHLIEQYARNNNCHGIELKQDPVPPFLRCRFNNYYKNIVLNKFRKNNHRI